MKTALIIVDLQNDFLPNGSLQVPGGNEIISTIDKLVHSTFDFIVASRDYHPKNHMSFASQHPGNKVGDVIDEQVLWPDHCVQGTHGSELAPGWDVAEVDHVVFKGTNPAHDSYSTFFDNQHIQSTGLNEYLKENDVDTIYLAGLATDYCVQFSALDALALGYKVYIITDGCRGVNLSKNDSAKALKRMQDAGAILIDSEILLHQ